MQLFQATASPAVYLIVCCYWTVTLQHVFIVRLRFLHRFDYMGQRQHLKRKWTLDRHAHSRLAWALVSTHSHDGSTGPTEPQPQNGFTITARYNAKAMLRTAAACCKLPRRALITWLLQATAQQLLLRRHCRSTVAVWRRAKSWSTRSSSSLSWRLNPWLSQHTIGRTQSTSGSHDHRGPQPRHSCAPGNMV